jgi:branched-chain amino acid transport system ATP-binding protein
MKVKGTEVSSILQLNNVSKAFGGIKAVTNVSFSIKEGEIIGLIGPNGAGKTTLVNLITGVHKLSTGNMTFLGKDITKYKPYMSARIGLARTFQVVQPFPEMTVFENVLAGALFGSARGTYAEATELTEKELDFVGLSEFVDAPASALTLPNRKKLELAKSLAMAPKILFLDEVNAGLNSGEIEGALNLIRKISDRGITILIIEHLMKVLLNVAERVLVIHHGEMLAEGSAKEIIEDERVIEAYLGSKFAERFKGSLR